jgi:hypothetical protein
MKFIHKIILIILHNQQVIIVQSQKISIVIIFLETRIHTFNRSLLLVKFLLNPINYLGL